jgi:flagellar hook protein FlgE
MSGIFAAVSGLRNHQYMLDIIGNNIANVNTVGFKFGRATFRELMAQTLFGASRPTQNARGGINPKQVGLGVTVGSIDNDFGQGSLEATGIFSDLAIQGDGFFILSDGVREYYTRSGAFSLDGNGALVDPGSGLIVQGWLADDYGEIPSDAVIGNLVIPNVSSPPQATSSVSLFGNLDADSEALANILKTSTAFIDDTTSGPADGTTELNDLQQTTSDLDDGDIILISGTDSDGTTISVNFTYGAANDGTTLQDLIDVINGAYAGSTATIDSDGYLVLTDDATGESSTSINLTFTDQGSASSISLPGFTTFVEGRETIDRVISATIFDSLGEQHTVSLTFTETATPGQWAWTADTAGEETILSGGSGTVTFNDDGSLGAFVFDGGVTTLKLDPQNGAPLVELTFDVGSPGEFDGLTQYFSATTAAGRNDNGYGSGNLESISFDQYGTIVAAFSNGVIRNLGKIAMATFDNPNGLTKLGGSYYGESANSGQPVKGAAGEVVQATIAAGFLEMSNVDLSQEFVKMIVAQRGFQANSRTITANDELTRELINLIR